MFNQSSLLPHRNRDLSPSGLILSGLCSNRTLVGSGLKQKSTLRRQLASLIPPHITHISENVASFDPAHNAVRTDSGRSLEYSALVVAMGLQVNFGAIEGLPKALADSSSGVSSIYSYQTCDKTWQDIDALRAGRAIFTQPQGIIKCAGGQHSISLPSPSGPP
jgi:eukaryotic sulfide quinone oxidoreductase